MDADGRSRTTVWKSEKRLSPFNNNDNYTLITRTWNSRFWKCFHFLVNNNIVTLRIFWQVFFAVVCPSPLAMTAKTKSNTAATAVSEQEESLENMLFFFNLSIRKLAFVGVSFPLITLLTCLATAYLFQYDDVHETHCQVSYLLFLVVACYTQTGVTGMSNLKDSTESKDPNLPCINIPLFFFHYFSNS